ncbi:hypothetical protein CKM354_000004800 [Cercospora kikuchii]|uniref:FAD-binding domain-containing protein n=1 Tax=Cercospora kikuchii TaxID=84275 RepID=A0A9P3C591_9PEZI|nr:uncharacterized protein CKM354_000004800 [Cercospora kikuchii]GIZ36578.1 hypothetical protein CKM354_000004800 [Cercospora kikuchii]
MTQDTQQRLSILVVGSGIGGLTFAIEACRKGHHVRVYERRPNSTSTGEMIVISKSALRPQTKWPDFVERLRQVASNAQAIFKRWDGADIAPFILGDSTGESLLINRGELHTVLRKFATEQGVSVEYDTAGEEFFETKDQGGIILKDGRKFTADLVVASDGIGSKSWKLFAGTNTSPVSSGFVLYRITFPVEEALKSPLVAERLGHALDTGFFYAGPDAHFIAGRIRNEATWMLTCRDHNSDAKESWSKPTTIDNALDAVKGWDEFVPEMIKTTPQGSVFDWKMMWRDPQPQWVSDGGRVVQLGDAAHPFLPTSGAGATMAMEDAFSLATCLDLGGVDNVPLATLVHNKLRFERVSCAQKMGFKNREMLHKTDWEFISQHPEVLSKLFFRNWINNHDPEEYAMDNYQQCAEHIRTGAPFTNTNHVPGYNYKPWSVRELLEASAKGQLVEDEGDWS